MLVDMNCINNSSIILRLEFSKKKKFRLSVWLRNGSNFSLFSSKGINGGCNRMLTVGRDIYIHAS